MRKSLFLMTGLILIFVGVSSFFGYAVGGKMKRVRPTQGPNAPGIRKLAADSG